jgi:NodT family efflux transporter outer membrane factor (OMF) lipoprotein
MLSGCRIPGLCCANPGAPLPADYNGETSEANSSQVGVCEFFNDPALVQLITNGLAQNLELKIRNQEIQIATNEIRARSGYYLPMVGAGAFAGIDRNSRFTPTGATEDQLTFPGGGTFPSPIPNFRVSADMTWHVDIFRQYRMARDAAVQRYYEAIERRNYLITQLVAETAENYYELAALDKRLVFLDQTIELQKQGLDLAKAQWAAARGTELGVQRFLAEVRKNESQRLIVNQSIIETENKINFRVGRYPQRVERVGWDLISLDSQMLSVGFPADILLNRRDIQAAEREVAAAGLDVLVARLNFFPKLDITASVGYEAFNTKYLFDPGSFIAGAAGGLVAPLINRRAIQAEYLNANARQLQAIYNYQRTVLNAFTEVVNSLTKARNYRRSVEIKLQQVTALEKSVSVARDLFNKPIREEFAKVEYLDVLLVTRDLLEARTVLIETKQQQLAAIVNAYRALGGGLLMTNSGMELSEFYCQIYETQSPDTIWPPLSDNQKQSSGPEGVYVPAVPDDYDVPPMPEEKEPKPAPDEKAPKPAADEKPAKPAAGKADLSPDSDEKDKPAAPGKAALPPDSKE